MLVFPGMALRADLVPGLTGTARPVSFSIRPNAITLHRTQPAADDSWCIGGHINERAFLGEHWDYLVQPRGSELRLRVATPPQQMHDVGSAVWIGIDPARLVEIPPADTTTSHAPADRAPQ